MLGPPGSNHGLFEALPHAVSGVLERLVGLLGLRSRSRTAELRISRPTEGYAISLPRDWTWAVAGEAHPEDWWDPEVVGDVHQRYEEELADGLTLLALSPRSAAPNQWCKVFMAQGPGWDTLAEAGADLVSRLEESAAVISVESAYHDLPSGRGLSIDAHWRHGRDTRDYLCTDGKRWMLLTCGTNEFAPVDRWLSIAQTLEFLPAE